MKNLRQKLYDFKNRLKDRHMLSIIVTLLIICAILGIILYKKSQEYRQTSENSYNYAFYELVDYVRNIENYLAKSLISSNAEHSAENLTQIWREADLAQSYLARLPLNNKELSNTAKFLNQVSEYSYSLSRKNIYNEDLNQQDLENLKTLYNYSTDLKNVLIQLSEDINQGTIKWGELTKKGDAVFAQEVSNISEESFSNIEENFHEYSGLIYDGAFSEHITSIEKKGLTGKQIEESEARNKVEEFIGTEKIDKIESKGLSENANIIVYTFEVITKNKQDIIYISVTKIGGHILFMNYNRDVNDENISYEQANQIGREFLKNKNYENMKETYYLIENGIITINYAYTQNEIIIYPDLIKLKIALDNGEILGIETTGYLNSHEERKIPEIKITKEEAKEQINDEVEILSENLAIIPTKWKTEILCWEIKGKLEDRECLIYVNVENKKQEDILMIINTPNGILTM